MSSTNFTILFNTTQAIGHMLGVLKPRTVTGVELE